MTKKILMIDDDPDFLLAMKTILEKANYECLEAHSANQGLQLVCDVNPDLIILDVMMEDISSGFRFAKELKKNERKRVPILMVTSVQKRTNLHFQKRVGTPLLPVDAFLEKPVDPKTLLEQVEAMIE